MKVAFAILCPCDVAQDDELHHRLRLNGLLYGDCFMALNFGHTKQCRTSLAFVANSSEPGINHLGYVAFWFGNLQATRALGVHGCFSLALRMRLSTLRKERPRPHHGEAGPVHSNVLRGALGASVASTCTAPTTPRGSRIAAPMSKIWSNLRKSVQVEAAGRRMD